MSYDDDDDDDDGPRPTSISSGILIYAAIWLQQICAKNWGAVPLWGRGAGSPSNTMWPGLVDW